MKFLKMTNFLVILKIIVSILFVIFFIRSFQNRIFESDLEVYYGATRKLFGLSLTELSTNAANQIGNNPYGFYYGLGSGVYKYAPFFLFLFFPIALIPWHFLIIILPYCHIAILPYSTFSVFFVTNFS